MIEKNSFMTYDIGWGLAGHIFFTRVHLFNRKFRWATTDRNIKCIKIAWFILNRDYSL